MKNRKVVLSLYIIVFLLIFLIGGILAYSIEINGYVRNYTSVLLQQSNKYSIVQNTLNLNIEGSNGNVAFKANPYIYHYPNEDIDIGLREAYLDIYLDSMDLRVGKQEIIWGKATGVFITDIVSPKDLSNFLMPDFDEIRMGVTGIKADYYIGNNVLEFVWLPVFTPTQTPENESIWYVSPSFSVPVTYDNSKEDVTPSLKNSDVFVKFSALTSLIDFEIMAGYAWDDDPTIHIVKSVDATTKQLTGVTLIPEHHRLAIGGGSFSTTLGGFVLRGEGAFYNGKYFQSSDPSLSEGIIKRDYIDYLLGLDFTVFNIKFSTQFNQKIIMNYNHYIVDDQYTNLLTFLASKNFLNNTLNLELFTYVGLSDQGYLIRPKITYSVADGFDVILGSNIFGGDSGTFGQYDDNDMVYFKVKYSF